MVTNEGVIIHVTQNIQTFYLVVAVVAISLQPQSPFGRRRMNLHILQLFYALRIFTRQSEDMDVKLYKYMFLRKLLLECICALDFFFGHFSCYFIRKLFKISHKKSPQDDYRYLILTSSLTVYWGISTIHLISVIHNTMFLGYQCVACVIQKKLTVGLGMYSRLIVCYVLCMPVRKRILLFFRGVWNELINQMVDKIENRGRSRVSLAFGYVLRNQNHIKK